MQIFFVGCGNMGGAIVSGMLESKNFKANQITAVLPSHSQDFLKLSQNFHINLKTEYEKDEIADIVIFAVKPQTLDEIIPEYAPLISKNSTIVSICAGKTIQYFSKYFLDHEIVRTMPNLNAMVGKGSTVGYSNKEITKEKKEVIEKIFGSIGSFTWVNDENIIDPVTAISGSGPAYYFLFTELLAKAGEEIGLPKELAMKLARETFIGSAAVLEKSEQRIEDLRQAVTSPNGTTEAALKTFISNEELSKLILQAAKAASDRAKELARTSA
jgi:pyrroline-5-carboxylate reductase